MPGRAFSSGFGGGFGSPEKFGTLVLKVGSVGQDPHYQDGDILVAVNRRRTRSVHAQHICHPRAAARAANGLIALDHVVRDWCEATRQYRFERVSATEVLRVNIATLAADLIGPTANAAGEYMDVPRFIARRKAAVGFALFGADGSEVWYGGGTAETDARLDAVWTAIETKTPLREVDHADWPAGAQDLKSHLVLRVDDFDDAEAEALVAASLDETDPENPVVVRKRARAVAWRSLPGMSASRIAQVEDRAVSVDIRAERKHPRALYVAAK